MISHNISKVLVENFITSKAADMAAVAPALFPEMRKRGADPGQLVALLAASGAMSETIPPSLVLITVGAVTGVSIAALFVGGLVPALVGLLALSVVVYFQSRHETLPLQARSTVRQMAKAFLIALPALSLPFVIRTAVVEGVGDHGCEYMTGGTVAVLGKTGRNFAAGMSGGIAYVFDEDGQFATRCNTAMVSLEKVLSAADQETAIPKAVWHREQSDEAQLKKLLEDHHRWTGSKRARDLLDNWSTARDKFVKVFPNEYKRALGEIHTAKTVKPAAPAKAKKAVATAK